MSKYGTKQAIIMSFKMENNHVTDPWKQMTYHDLVRWKETTILQHYSRAETFLRIEGFLYRECDVDP